MIHFVGFRGDEYLRAIRVFGKPDFFHRSNDRRDGEFDKDDLIVYANGFENKPTKYTFNDSEVF